MENEPILCENGEVSAVAIPGVMLLAGQRTWALRQIRNNIFNFRKPHIFVEVL